MSPRIKAFFHEPTFTVSYVVADSQGQSCCVIDSVLDYDGKSGRTSTHAVDEIIAYIREAKMSLNWILETHVHADHLSAAPYLQSELGGQVAIGSQVPQVQEVFKKVFNADNNMSVDGAQFDRLLADGEVVECGDINIEVLFSPGHTPACVSYIIGDSVFVGDTLFMPDYGTARCDFPGGDAAQLYKSIRKILSLPPETKLFTCHDYGPNGRDYAWKSNVAEQKEKNIHINESITETEFVQMRTDRDAGLDFPALILPSVQVNMCAGKLPEPESNGVSYLKVPINSL